MEQLFGPRLRKYGIAATIVLTAAFGAAEVAGAQGDAPDSTLPTSTTTTTPYTVDAQPSQPVDATSYRDTDDLDEMDAVTVGALTFVVLAGGSIAVGSHLYRRDCDTGQSEVVGPEDDPAFFRYLGE